MIKVWRGSSRYGQWHRGWCKWRHFGAGGANLDFDRWNRRMRAGETRGRTRRIETPWSGVAARILANVWQRQWESGGVAWHRNPRRISSSIGPTSTHPSRYVIHCRARTESNGRREERRERALPHEGESTTKKLRSDDKWLAESLLEYSTARRIKREATLCVFWLTYLKGSPSPSRFLLLPFRDSARARFTNRTTARPSVSHRARGCSVRWTASPPPPPPLHPPPPFLPPDDVPGPGLTLADLPCRLPTLSEYISIVRSLINRTWPDRDYSMRIRRR